MNHLQKTLSDIAADIDQVAQDAGMSGDMLADLRKASESLRRCASRAEDREPMDPREALERFSERRAVVVEESAEQAGFCERCGTVLSKTMLGSSSCHMCGWRPGE